MKLKRNAKKNFFPLLLAAGTLTAAAAGLGLFRGEEPSPLETNAASGAMVKTVQTGLEGKKYELEVYRDASGLYYLSDCVRNIVVFDGTDISDSANYNGDYIPFTSKTETFDDPTAVTLFYNCVRTYDAYASGELGFSINGITDKNDGEIDDSIVRGGGTAGEVKVYAVAHLNGIYDRYNASFSPEFNSAGQFTHGFMCVGDGSPWETNPDNPKDTLNYYHMYQQARSLDTIGHEYQHGITRNTWRYMTSPKGDLGAINEATSDIFGMLIKNAEAGTPIDEKSWDVGLEATFDGIALRSMREHTQYYRYSLSERMVCTHEGAHNAGFNCDNQGVHYNSTILSSAQYEAWKKQPSLFSREKIGKLWMETIKKITPDSATLEDFAAKIVATAQELAYEPAAIDALAQAFMEKGFEFCKVTFENPDGTVLKTQYLQKGESATPPEAPSMTSDVQYDYSFKSWDKEAKNVSGDITVQAEYDKTLRKYEVSYYVDGTLWKKEQLEYGALNPLLPPDGYDEWYLDEAFTKPAQGALLSSDLSLYAKESSSLGLILGIAIPAGVVLIGGAVLAVLLVKKKRKGE